MRGTCVQMFRIDERDWRTKKAARSLDVVKNPPSELVVIQEHRSSAFPSCSKLLNEEGSIQMPLHVISIW